VVVDDADTAEGEHNVFPDRVTLAPEPSREREVVVIQERDERKPRRLDPGVSREGTVRLGKLDEPHVAELLLRERRRAVLDHDRLAGLLRDHALDRLPQVR